MKDTKALGTLILDKRSTQPARYSHGKEVSVACTIK